MSLLSDRYRRQAAMAVLDRLEIDPDHPELLELQKQATRPLAVNGGDDKAEDETPSSLHWNRGFKA